MYDLVCEGLICSTYTKCEKYEKRTGNHKCFKPLQFQNKGCHYDNHNTCKDCNNLTNCEIILPYKEGLHETQQRISDIRTILKENPTDEELKEELTHLRLKEKRQIDLLRRRAIRNIKGG